MWAGKSVPVNQPMTPPYSSEFTALLATPSAERAVVFLDQSGIWKGVDP
jgi:hypothetical protein